MENHQPLVLVTGSSGLIGSAVCERLVDDHLVIGLDKQPPRDDSPVRTIIIDLATEHGVSDALAEVRQDYGDRIASVVHLAAYYDFSGEPSDLYEKITVGGTRRLLQKLQSFDVEQFLFSSTMLVHAPCKPGQKINEDWPLEPKWDYPRSKAQTEDLIRQHHGDIPIVLLRIAGVYDDRCHSIPLAHQIQRIYERWLTSHVFPGDTSRGQAFVHLDDVVESIALAVEKRHALPKELTLLIGEDETLSYEDLQHRLGVLIHGREWTTQQIPKTLAKTGAWFQDKLPGEDPFIKPWMIDLADDHYELDITRARESLGWQPRHKLRDALPAMVQALKDDPARWYHDNKIELPKALEHEPVGAGR